MNRFNAPAINNVPGSYDEPKKATSTNLDEILSPKTVNRNKPSATTKPNSHINDLDDLDDLLGNMGPKPQPKPKEAPPKKLNDPWDGNSMTNLPANNDPWTGGTGIGINNKGNTSRKENPVNMSKVS
jgi:hypothetical protein